MPLSTRNRVISRRPTLPLPSRNGWIAPNCACISAARARGGRLSSYRNLSHSPRHRISSEGGGGQPDFFRLRPRLGRPEVRRASPAFPRCGWTGPPPDERRDGLRYGDCGQASPLACEPSDGPVRVREDKSKLRCPHKRRRQGLGHIGAVASGTVDHATVRPTSGFTCGHHIVPYSRV